MNIENLLIIATSITILAVAAGGLTRNYYQNEQILKATTCEQVVAIASPAERLTDRLLICKEETK